MISFWSLDSLGGEIVRTRLFAAVQHEQLSSFSSLSSSRAWYLFFRLMGAYPQDFIS